MSNKLVSIVSCNIVAISLVSVSILIGLPECAFASLGGNASTIDTDNSVLQARIKVKTTQLNGQYSSHEHELPNGTAVRQYVSNSNVVFAVTWSGPAPVNLKQLLGQHFKTMTTSYERSNMQGLHSSHIKEGALVIDSYGIGKSFYGRAYLTDALPIGVDPISLP